MRIKNQESRIKGSNATSCCANFYQHPLVEKILGRSWHPGGLDLTRRLARRFTRGPVLDVACGAGESARVLREEFGLDVIGLDARAQGPTVRGDAMLLPLRDAGLRGALVECALSTFDDQPRALAEIRRVLAPGGVLALSDMIVEGPLPPGFDGAVAQVACLAKAHDGNGWMKLLREAGFEPRYEDRADDLRSFLERVDDRVRAFQVVLGANLDVVRRHLDTARGLVEEGRLGYAAFTASR